MDLTNSPPIQFEKNTSTGVIIAIFGILIVNCTLIDKGYYEIMPNDLINLLDGAYRVHLGQVPHRDFSTVIGPLQYIVPALFMDMSADALSGLRYYNAILLLLALPAVIYIQRTRMNGIFSIFFAALVGLTIACKLMLGYDPSLQSYGVTLGSTTAMMYNRIGFASLILQVALYASPGSSRDPKRSTVDGLIIGALCGVAFYSKITFGLVSLGLLALNLVSRKSTDEKLRYAGGSLLVFALIVVVVEFVAESVFGGSATCGWPPYRLLGTRGVTPYGGLSGPSRRLRLRSWSLWASSTGLGSGFPFIGCFWLRISC